MASIQKDEKTGKWFCRVTYYDGSKRKLKTKKGFATQKEAKVYATELEYELNQGREITKLENCFADDFEEWVKKRKLGKYSHRTEAKYKAEIKRVHAYFGKTKWKNLTRSMYQEYLDKRGKGNGEDVVMKTHSRLKGCIKEAIADGYLSKDPTYGVEFNYDNEPQHRIKVWSKKNAALLFKRFKIEMIPRSVMLYISLATGLRIGEVYGLSWEDIDIKNKTLRVQRGYDYGPAKTFTKGKNKQSLRTIPITSELSKLIMQYKIKYQKLYPEYLFLDPTPYPAVSYKTLWQYLHDVCKELGIKKLPIHTLRHTHCSLLIFEGVSIHYISKRLGHKGVTETLKTYSHLFDEFEQQQNEKAIQVLESLEM